MEDYEDDVGYEFDTDNLVDEDDPDFKFEYAFESITTKGSQFKKNSSNID